MTSRKIYLLSLGLLLLISIYPFYMGGIMILAYIKNGGIDAADYPSYIIPYTPICIALITSIALLPLIFKLCKRFALPVLSAFGTVFFIGVESVFEKIAVFTDTSTKMKLETWQLLSCIGTPLVKRSIWDSLNIRYNSSFKIHFYAIALLIILAVIGIIYGFYKMAYTQNFTRKKLLIIQLISVIIFIGLCLLACFTAFFRTGDINVSPLSAALMTIFFLMFGITAGVYAGTWLYEKQKLFSVFIPSVVAMLVTIIMYIGEMVMMDWNLFRLGRGVLFGRIGSLPLSAFDVITILLSGVITYFILTVIKPTAME